MIDRNLHIIKPLALLLLVVFGLLTSCNAPNKSDALNNDWTLTQNQRDSLRFIQNHHYNLGYNFIMQSDSVELLSAPDFKTYNLDYAPGRSVVHEGQDFVVVEICRDTEYDSTHTDSIWLRVGSDDIPLGWIPESKLLESSTPLDPISRCIHWFSGVHLYYFYVIAFIVAAIFIFRMLRHKKIWMVHFSDVASIYPTLFSISIATAAMLYALIQMYATDSWVEFYFHPTLNPLGQPFIISFFLFFLWLSVILLLSVVFDLKDKVSFSILISYLLSLIAWAGVLYIVITLTSVFYVGYVFYLVYVILAVARYLSKKRTIQNTKKS